MKNLEFRIKKEQSKAIRRLPLTSILHSQFLILCVCLLLESNAMAGELRFRFQPGDKYSLVSATERKTSVVVDGNEKGSVRTTRLECDFDIEEVDESGTAWAKYTYKHFTMKLQSEEQRFDFDSDSNQVKIPMQAMPLRLAVGEEIYLQITPQGRIGKINGLKALTTYAKAKIGGAPSNDVIIRNVVTQFAELAVRRELENQMAVFPEANQGPTVWSRKEILSSADVGQIVTDQIEEVNTIFEKTFRLNNGKSGQGGIAFVDVNLVIRPASTLGSSTPVLEFDTISTREVLGEGVGQIEIEEATGRIISNKMTLDMAERVKYITPSQMLRPPPAQKPVLTHTVTTFQMVKTADGKAAEPVDINEKAEK
jgi:hypothetical protein